MRRLVALVVCVLGALAAVASSARSAESPAAGGTSPQPRFGAATVLPDPTGRPSAEPGMAVDGDGTIWIGAIHGGFPPAPADPTNTTVQGTALWRSTATGWQPVRDPLQVTPTTKPGIHLGGFDADVGAAPDVNPGTGRHNVYVTSLGPPTGILLAWSTDGGRTFVVNPLGGLPSAQADRPWVVAEGACGLYLAYRSGPPWWVSRYDLCRPDAWVAPVSSVQVTATGLGNIEALVGKLVVDRGAASPRRGRVYVPMEVCEQTLFPPPGGEQAADCEAVATISVAYSDDEGRTWTRRRVAPMGRPVSPIWPVTAAVDDAGTVYVAWFDDHDAFLAGSSDGGESWSSPMRLNEEPSAAAYPTVAARGRGHVDVAWYGTARDGDANDAAAMGPAGAPGSAEWRVWLARSLNGGRSLTFRRAVTPAVHVGELCTHGSRCLDSVHTRSLLDDFAVVHDRDGRVVVAYTTDQPIGDLNNAHVGVVRELSR